MNVGSIPDGYWFELKRTGEHYYKISKGNKGYQSLCAKLGELKAYNISNQCHAKLIKHKGVHDAEVVSDSLY